MKAALKFSGERLVKRLQALHLVRIPDLQSAFFGACTGLLFDFSSWRYKNARWYLKADFGGRRGELERTALQTRSEKNGFLDIWQQGADCQKSPERDRKSLDYAEYTYVTTLMGFIIASLSFWHPVLEPVAVGLCSGTFYEMFQRDSRGSLPKQCQQTQYLIRCIRQIQKPTRA